MSEIKSVISLLCKHIEQCTSIKIESEYFRAGKYNEESSEAVQCFWSVLSSLSHAAVRGLQLGINFQAYSKSTKLNFAYLQYPSIEFYTLSENSAKNSRALLLALSWLIAHHNALDTSVRFNLAESTLCHECVQSDDSQKVLQTNESTSMELKDQAQWILHKCTKVSNNIKEINELMNERIKSTDKIHTASLNSCGLSHIHLPEMSIIKQYVTHDGRHSQDNEKNLEDLQWKGLMIDTQFKWKKNEEVFFNWMTTVLDEHKSSYKPEELSEKSLDELETLICILRHLSKKKIHSLKNKNDRGDIFPATPIASRFSRVKNKDNEANHWCSAINEQLSMERNYVREKMNELSLELKFILQSIPGSLQI